MENNYLIVDDLLNIDLELIAKEFLEKMPIPQRGKVISGTFGTFSIKDVEN